MRMRFVGLSLAAVVVALSACGDVAQPAEEVSDLPTTFTASMAAGPAVYVLERVESQTAAPIVLFDHPCRDGRIVQSVEDTITLALDGSMRRAFVMARTIGQAPATREFTVTTGRWRASQRRRAEFYFGDGPSITISSTTENGRTVPEYQFRIREATALSMLSGLGGSCPGSPNDGREAEFTYGRR